MSIHRIALLSFAVASYAAEPVPFINQPLEPTSAIVNAGPVGLTLNGGNFTETSVVNWNGTPVSTRFLNNRQLRAYVPASYVTTPTTASITVTNPGPKSVPSNSAFFEVASAIASSVYPEKMEFSVGVSPIGVVTGDFNRDGKTDAVVANLTSNSISILIGNGDGTFQPAVNYAGVDSQQPYAITTGDFNGDGIPDLAIVSAYFAAPGYAYTMLGNGDGTFQPPGPELVLGELPRAIQTADFNRDGNLDLAIGNGDNNFVSIFLGNGAGTFGPRSDYPADYGVDSIFLADLNNDSKIDIATANYTNCNVSLFIGRGDGTFNPAHTLSDVCSPVGITGGDLNGDGQVDLVTANEASNGISVYLGKGNGAYYPYQTYDAGGSITGVAIADLNDDGNLDVLAVGGDFVSVLLNNGTGKLELPLIYSYGGSPQALALANLNNDGRSMPW